MRKRLSTDNAVESVLAQCRQSIASTVHPWQTRIHGAVQSHDATYTQLERANK